MRVWGDTNPKAFPDGNRIKDAERDCLVKKALHAANVRYTLNVQKALNYENMKD